jgi:hypothetical protein
MDPGVVESVAVSSRGSDGHHCATRPPGIPLNLVITGIAVAVTYGIGLLAKTLLGIAV